MTIQEIRDMLDKTEHEILTAKLGVGLEHFPRLEKDRQFAIHVHSLYAAANDLRVYLLQEYGRP